MLYGKVGDVLIIFHLARSILLVSEEGLTDFASAARQKRFAAITFWYLIINIPSVSGFRKPVKP